MENADSMFDSTDLSAINMADAAKTAAAEKRKTKITCRVVKERMTIDEAIAFLQGCKADIESEDRRRCTVEEMTVMGQFRINTVNLSPASVLSTRHRILPPRESDKSAPAAPQP